MENSYKKKSNEKLDSENAEQHLENNETPTKKANRKKVPMYAFFKFVGVSEQTLQEAANRYEMGFFSNVAFIIKNSGAAFKRQTPVGKVTTLAKVALLPYYLLLRKPIKALEKKLFNNNRLKVNGTVQNSNSTNDNLELIQEYPSLIQKIDRPSEELQLAAVKAQGNLIKYIKDPTPNVAWEAVHKDPRAIQYVKNAPFDLEHYAIREGGFPILGLLNQATEQHFCALVIERPFEIQYLNNPSQMVRNLAIAENAGVLNLLSNPTEKEFMLALKSEELDISSILTNHHNIPETVLIKYVEHEPNAIRLIKNPSDEVIATALIKDFGCLTHIDAQLNPNALQKVGMILHENDINAIPSTILGVELTDDQRELLLNKQPINDFPLEKSGTTTFSVSFNQDNILVLGEQKQEIDTNHTTFSAIHIAKTNLIDNSIEKPLKFDIDAFISRMAKPEQSEIIAPELGMKLPF